MEAVEQYSRSVIIACTRLSRADVGQTKAIGNSLIISRIRDRYCAIAKGYHPCQEFLEGSEFGIALPSPLEVQ